MQRALEVLGLVCLFFKIKTMADDAFNVTEFLLTGANYLATTFPFSDLEESFTDSFINVSGSGLTGGVAPGGPQGSGRPLGGGMGGPPGGSQGMGGPGGITLVRKLRLAIQAFIMLVGIPGNILTIVIMCRKKFRSMNLCILFIALSVADTIWLFFMPGKEVYELIQGVKLQNTNDVLCKVTVFMIWTLQTLSSWLLVALTCERCLAILSPFNYKTMCSQFKDLVLILFILALVVGYNIQALVTLTLRQFGPRTACAAAPKYEWYQQNIKLKIDIILQNFIPFVIILVANIAIIVRVRSANDKLTSVNTESEKQIKRKQKAERMTGMLLGITFAFLILTLPMKVYLILAGTQQKIAQALDFNNGTYLIVYSLNTLNYGINFYMYVITGTDFRQEFLKMFGMRRTEIDRSSFRNTRKTITKQNKWAQGNGRSIEEVPAGGEGASQEIPVGSKEVPQVSRRNHGYDNGDDNIE